jgi:ankyrin repeat protein
LADISAAIVGKVDADSKDNGGRTPLSLAARDGHEAVVKLLDTGKVDADSKEGGRELEG